MASLFYMLQAKMIKSKKRFGLHIFGFNTSSHHIFRSFEGKSMQSQSESQSESKNMLEHNLHDMGRRLIGLVLQCRVA